MPGPPPKKKALRQRRNKTTTAAKLEVPSDVEVPPLPVRPCHWCERDVLERARAAKNKTKRGRKTEAQKKADKQSEEKERDVCVTCLDTRVIPWHAETLSWWGALWRSPLCSEYMQVDLFKLCHVANLIDRINWSGAMSDPKDLAELRMWGREFGFTPMARRALQWEMPNAPKKEQAVSDVDEEEDEDPRMLLRLVKK